MFVYDLVEVDFVFKDRKPVWAIRVSVLSDDVALYGHDLASLMVGLQFEGGRAKGLFRQGWTFDGWLLEKYTVQVITTSIGRFVVVTDDEFYWLFGHDPDGDSVFKLDRHLQDSGRFERGEPYSVCPQKADFEDGKTPERDVVSLVLVAVIVGLFCYGVLVYCFG